jgi:cytochrome c556
LKRTSKVIAISLLALFVAPVSADEDISDPDTRFRQESMKAARSHFKAIKHMQEGMLDYEGQLRVHAHSLQLFFSSIPDLFPKEGDYSESEASPEIWKQWEEFNNFARQGDQAAGELAVYRDAYSPEASEVFDRIKKACKGCHDQFRE